MAERYSASLAWRRNKRRNNVDLSTVNTKLLYLADCRCGEIINPLKCRGNYIATSNNMKLVHWPLMGGLSHLVQRGGDLAGRGPSPPMPLLAVPNITAHPSTASVPITILLYNGPLLCSFNVSLKG